MTQKTMNAMVVVAAGLRILQGIIDKNAGLLCGGVSHLVIKIHRSAI